MFPSGSKRRKKSREFEILVVPRGDGGGTRSIAAGASKLVAWGGAISAVVFLLFFLAFRFTPLGRLVYVPESSNGAVSDTERRIKALAAEIAILKDYNETLRKALGERVEKKETDIVPERTEEMKTEPSFDQPMSSPQPTVSSTGMDSRNVGGIGERTRVSLPLFVPTNGVVTQGFEPEQRHFGVDYAAKEGTPVHAAAKGYVLFSGWTYEEGNVIIVSHGGGVITAYKHNQSLLKSVGSSVKRGEVIALVGNTGRTSKGPHLHFEVLQNGAPEDPSTFLITGKNI